LTEGLPSTGDMATALSRNTTADMDSMSDLPLLAVRTADIATRPLPADFVAKPVGVPAEG
jgi:hypothetical protein